MAKTASSASVDADRASSEACGHRACEAQELVGGPLALEIVQAGRLEVDRVDPVGHAGRVVQGLTEGGSIGVRDAPGGAVGQVVDEAVVDAEDAL